MHTYECSSGEHVIFDNSSEEVPHVGKLEQIYCPACEEDVYGEYLGQNINDSLRYGETPPTSEVQLFVDAGDSEAYCIHCGGECKQ